MPRYDFVAVSVFDRHTAYSVNGGYFVCTETVNTFAEYHRGVVAADTADELSSPDTLKRLYDVSPKRPLRIPEHDGKPGLPDDRADPLRYQKIVHVRFTGTCRACLDIPAVTSVPEIFTLFY
jgi:hypothetical protein